MLTDSYFWFTQPPTAPNTYDLWAFYLFAGMVVASFLLWGLRYMLNHTVVKQALAKWVYLLITTGLSGLIWYGFRYENTPIFAKRYWAGSVLIIGIIWAGWILKYMLFRFNTEKTEYDNNLIKSRYLPKSKK